MYFRFCFVFYAIQPGPALHIIQIGTDLGAPIVFLFFSLSGIIFLLSFEIRHSFIFDLYFDFYFDQYGPIRSMFS